MKPWLAIRFLLLFAYVIAQVYTIYLVHGDPGHDLKVVEYISSAILGFTILSFWASTKSAIDLNGSKNEAQAENKILSVKLGESNRKLSVIDGELRKEIGGWLHGSVQSKLMAIARALRTPGKDFDPNKIADLVDDLNENTIREYSHQLFPPSLHISLAVGLKELVGDDIELQLDGLLDESANPGLDEVDTKYRSGFDQSNDRLILPSTLALAVYRIVEEAINNARKKSSVSKIKVVVRVQEKLLVVQIEDDGEKLSTDYQHGLGLSLVDVYTSQFDGDFKLENTKDGVVLRATLKFEPVTVREVVNAKIATRFNKNS